MSDNHKKKHIGFRVSTPQYFSIIEEATICGQSITEFIIRKIFPFNGEDDNINNVEQEVLSDNIENEEHVKHNSTEKEPLTHTEELTLFSEENEILLNELTNKYP